MNRRHFLMLGPAALAERRPAPAASKPNIVLFLADDLGFGDLSSYGAPDIRTPHIDSIGRRGVRFTNYYNNAPECTPTRTALLTGRYQQRVGGLECAIGVGEVGRYDEAVWLAERGELGLPSSERTMAQILKGAGYDTACIGKWHLGYREKFLPGAHGFDEHFGILGGNADYFTHLEQGGAKVLAHNGKLVDRKGYLTDLFGDAAVNWLKARKDRPFLLYLPFNAPHTPIQAPGDATERQGHRPTYAKMVARMDHQVGRVLDQLRTMGAERDTLVIFASDNGGDANGRNDPYRGRKGALWEGGIRSPLLVRWPSSLNAGATVEQLGMTMDLLPTMLAAAGVRDAAVKFDGIDLLPSMRGERKPFDRTLFWRYKRLENRRKAVRRGNLKYVIDNGQEELHNLAKDPREQNNLLPQASSDAAHLRGLLDAWEREVAAPRLKGFRNV
jgi:N-acetylgalactosamine-6-sulfatase